MSELTNIEKSILNDIIQDPTIGRTTISEKYNIPENTARRLVKECKTAIRENDGGEKLDDVYDKLLEHSALLEKQRQRLRDQQRIERKIRDKIRVDNAIEDYTINLIEIIKEKHFEPVIIKHENVKSTKTGVLCLSDLHLNELIDLSHNKYDFTIASKRLKKYVTEAKQLFKSQGITNIVISFLGDLLNSTRRTDEMLNQATSLAKANLLTVYLLEQLILDLNIDFNISIVSVSGNESRVDDEQGHTELMLTNNHDFTINEILKIIFRNTNIKFIGKNKAEQTVSINGQNILFMHGDQVGRGDIEKKIMQIKGKYSAQDVIIDYVVFGHIHSSYIADTFARSSSLCGANAYSDNGLQLSSKASQLILFVSKESINGMRIDLQEYDGYDGYNIDKNLEEYCPKSVLKLKKMNSEKIVVEITT